MVCGGVVEIYVGEGGMVEVGRGERGTTGLKKSVGELGGVGVGEESAEVESVQVREISQDLFERLGVVRAETGEVEGEDGRKKLGMVFFQDLEELDNGFACDAGPRKDDLVEELGAETLRTYQSGGAGEVEKVINAKLLYKGIENDLGGKEQQLEGCWEVACHCVK